MNLEDTSSQGGHATNEWFTDEHILLDELQRGNEQSNRDVRIPSIPGYTDLMELSRGGQGIVYSGVQISTKRRVAIKVLLDKHNYSATARHRFSREIDLIASLKHPNIVRIYDSGITEDDQLFFVMEFIEGESLDEYLDFAHMPPSLPDVPTESSADKKRVINAFLRIATAVSHAHQRGVIHRDLKPSNIRIDNTGEPHVLDFGLAKIADELTDSESTVWRTETSQVGSFFGSLPWASPEQAEGEHRTIDVRSDVYSIGVMLYQALAGSFPYDMTGSMREILNRISHDEPRRDASNWRRHGADLETIVFTCLAKDPQRRYQSAHELANDLQRLKANEPIMARPDSFAYRARKFIRRNRAMVAAASLLLILLIGYGITMSFLYQKATTAEQLATKETERATTEAARATAESKRASEEATRATAVNRFLEDMLASTDPKFAGYDVTVREVLDASSANLDQRFANQPLVRAALHEIIGNTYVGLSDYVAGEKHWRAALAGYTKELGPDDVRTLRAQQNLATNLTHSARYDEAKPIIDDVIERTERVHGADSQLALGALNIRALWLESTEQFEEAETLYRDLCPKLAEAFGEDSVEAVDSLNNYGLLLLNMGRFDESLEKYERAYELDLEALGPEHPRTVKTMCGLAGVLTQLGELDRAEELLSDAYQIAQESMGENHQTTIMAFSDLLNVKSRRGEFENAIPQVKIMLESMRNNLGAEHEETMNMVNTLAVMHYRAGDLDEAARLLEESLQITRQKFGDENVHTLTAWTNLATVLRANGELEKAEQYMREALPPANAYYGKNHVDYAWTLQAFAKTLYDLERYEESLQPLLQAVAIVESQLPEKHYRVADARESLGKSQVMANDVEQGLTTLKSALEASEEGDITTAVRIMTFIAETEAARGNDDIAATWREKIKALTGE